MSAFLLAAGVIFIAELGDKSQLLVLWFSTRYHWLTVFAGVTAATLLLTLSAALAGRALDNVIPERPLAIVVGLSFLAFAWWSWRGEGAEEEHEPGRERWRLPLFGSFGIVASAFFLAEFGDKTQLATVSLAGSNPSLVGVWLGSTAGMLAADGVAIAAGRLLGRRLPERTIGRAAAVLFVLFGLGIIARAFM